MASHTDGNSYSSTTEDGTSPWGFGPQPISAQSGTNALGDTPSPARSIKEIREDKISHFNRSFNPKTDIGAFATVSKAMDFADTVMLLFSAHEHGDGEPSWNPYQTYAGESNGARTFCDTILMRAKNGRLGTVSIDDNEKDGKSLRNVYEACLWAEVHNHSDIFIPYSDFLRGATATMYEEGESEPQQKIDFNDVVTAFEETFGDPESIIDKHQTDDEDLTDLFTKAKDHIKSFRRVISEGRKRWEQSCTERKAFQASNANADSSAQQSVAEEHADTVNEQPTSRDESRNLSNRSNSEQRTSVGLSLKSVISSMAIAGG